MYVSTTAVIVPPGQGREQIQYLIDHDWTTAPAGSTVFIPPGRVHAFRNAGVEPARHLAIASPADTFG